MGRKAGFRSGKIMGKYCTVDDRYVPNSIILKPSDFQLAGGITNSGVYSGEISGVYMFGWSSTNSGKASVAIVAPTNIPAKAKTDISVFWTSDGTFDNKYSGIVMDVEYRTIDTIVSGVTAVSGVNYQTSGVFNNATTTYAIISGGYVNALPMQKTTVTIPAFHTRAGAVMVLQLYRDSGETADTYDASVDVVVVNVEFVE